MTKEYNWNTLSKKTQEIVNELILEAAENRNGPEGWKHCNESIEPIEFESRSGFIPFSHNKGGLTYQNFSDLMGYFGGGYRVSHEGAQKEIDRQIDHAFECINEELTAYIGKKDAKKYFKSNPINYTTISELYNSVDRDHKDYSKFKDWMSKVEDLEFTYLSGNENSIMHEIRFMYHGYDSKTKKHSASVSAAVNTEGPYHRSHIPWAPNVFCEGAKEIEITWRTQAELKKKLKKVLNQVSKEIF